MNINNMNNYKKEVIKYIIDNPKIFNTLLLPQTMNNISIWCDEIIVNYFKNPLLGFSFKETRDVNEINYYLKCKKSECKIKQYDILICLENMKTSVKEANNSKKKEKLIEEDVAIKSLITHELMHSISIGFVINGGNWLKDEAYTDYYAKKVFESICSDEAYFTPYDFLDYVVDKEKLDKKNDKARNQELFEQYSGYYQQIGTNPVPNYFQLIKE